MIQQFKYSMHAYVLCLFVRVLITEARRNPPLSVSGPLSLSKHSAYVCVHAYNEYAYVHTRICVCVRTYIHTHAQANYACIV